MTDRRLASHPSTLTDDSGLPSKPSVIIPDTVNPLTGTGVGSGDGVGAGVGVGVGVGDGVRPGDDGDGADGLEPHAAHSQQAISSVARLRIMSL